MSQYNGIRIEIKNECPITVGVLYTQPGFESRLSFAHIANISPTEYETYELPFGCFRSQKGAAMIGDGNLLTRFAVMVKGRNSGTYKFWIKSASAINRKEMPIIQSQYNENIMFKYKNYYMTEGIDTGIKKFKLTNRNNI